MTNCCGKSSTFLVIPHGTTTELAIVNDCCQNSLSFSHSLAFSVFDMKKLRPKKTLHALSCIFAQFNFHYQSLSIHCAIFLPIFCGPIFGLNATPGENRDTDRG